MIRITTNSSLRMYRSNLMKSTNSLNSAMTKLMTQRQFSSYASDPAAATRAFKIHSSLNATNAQYSNNDTVLHKYETAWSTLESVLDGYDGLVQDSGRVPLLSVLNDTNLSTANTQGQIIREGAEAIVQAMNAKYGNNFVFAGADSLNPPFAINDDGFITYRGVEIDNPKSLPLEYSYTDEQGNIQHIPDPNDPTRNLTNEEVLNMWNEEHQYVDIGLGFKLDGNGEVIPSTAFDSAISGIGVMGYGVDADGDPKNLASIMLRLADIFEDFDEEKMEWGNAGSRADAERLLGKLDVAYKDMKEQWTTLDTEANFLDKNGTQLENTYDALNVERSNLEDIDPADAILELVWAQTCYNAALQVGTNVIPQSLMDYMK